MAQETPTPPVVPAPERPVPPTNRALGFAIEGGRTLLLVAISALLLTTAGQVFMVEQQSMEPTLTPGQRVVVFKLPFFGPFAGGAVFNAPKRNDIVVIFHVAKQEHMVKRVIGMPGDTVEARDGRLYVNNQLISEREYLSSRVRTGTFKAVAVPAEHYFVIGDNRDNSLDSRNFGPVAKSAFVGVVIFSVWPLDRFGTY